MGCRAMVLGMLVVAAVAGGVPTDARANSIVIFPTDDDRGIDSFLDGNFLCCQFDPGQATVTITPFFEERAALELALGALPLDAIITSVTLTLFVPVDPATLNFAELYGYAGNGTVEAADLSNLSNFLTGFQVSADGSFALAIAPGFLQTLLTNNEGFAGLLLRNVTNPGGVFSIWTTDSGFSQFDPRLTVDFESVPEPGSLVFLTIGMAAFGRRIWLSKGRRSTQHR